MNDDNDLRWPLLTAALPGCGGVLREDDDFCVEEIPAYLPCGEGDHTYAWIEKRGLTTGQAVERLSRAAGQAPGDAGYAGLKDKRGLTRQWISFAGDVRQQLASVDTPELRVLQVDRHRNKLKTGHLRGNRFAITLHEVAPDAAALAAAKLAQLRQTGVPNYFGAQRFGAAGDNANAGLALLRGESAPPRDKRIYRLMLSALQSEIFNDVLAERVRQGDVDRLLGGEVLQRCDSGGLFVSEASEVDQPRVDRHEVAITGPICGPRMPRPADASAARQREDAAFEQRGIEPEAFSRFGRLARGGRRALVVHLAEVTAGGDQSTARLQLSFVLPAGSYATVLLRELAGASVARGR